MPQLTDALPVSSDDLRRQIRHRRDELSLYAQLYYERFRVKLRLANLCANDDHYQELVTRLAAMVKR